MAALKVHIKACYFLLDDTLSQEDEQALRWLDSTEGITPRVLTTEDLRSGPLPGGCDVLWIHISDRKALGRLCKDENCIEALSSFYKLGGKLLFTNFASHLPFEAGIESCKAEIRPLGIKDEGFGRKMGFQGFRGHPVFRDFHGGLYVWDGCEDHTSWRMGYFGSNEPREGRVAAVEKVYIKIVPESKLIIEHSGGPGRALSIGSFINFSGMNNLRLHLERFMMNAFEYLALGPGGEPVSYWIKGKTAAERFGIEMQPAGRGAEISTGDGLSLAKMSDNLIPDGLEAFSSADGDNLIPDGLEAFSSADGDNLIPDGSGTSSSAGGTEFNRSGFETPSSSRKIDPVRGGSGLSLSRNSVPGAYCEVAGRRCLVMCREEGGIAEVWVHPFRLLSDLTVGVVGNDRVTWLDELPSSVEIRPESITRRYRAHSFELTEMICASLDKPGGFIRFSVDSGEPLDLVITFKSDLRWMWPYPENALGGILYGFDDVLGAFHLKDRSGDFYCMFGGNLSPMQHISGSFLDIRVDSGRLRGVPGEGDSVVHALTYRLEPGTGSALDFVMAGSSSGRREAEEVYRLILAAPGELYKTCTGHYRELLALKAELYTPDRDFNEGYRWAVVGTDRFIAATPGLGVGLTAGYAPSGSGWDGGHDISGRPGYAWYFGRDGAWASLAIDAYGDFDSVKAQLDLFRKYQDISGKIFHELTTSGVVHYDAADSTPLYVILAAHYLRASGDLDFIRSLRPSLIRAMEFMYSTDSDGDGLIENTNVGHGWVESGFLFGAHTTLYLAGLWARALFDAAYLADKLGEGALRNAWMNDAIRVRQTINDDFWNKDSRFFHHGKLADGSYRDERTIMPAVLMGFGILDDVKVGCMLDEFAGNGFSTDWGIRMLSSASPHFNPAAYHAGTVWPLFTGWAALAEFEYGRSVQGFTHMMNNVLVKRHWALGFVEEVLHGMRYQPAGVCPHQCWSETSIVHPAVCGMAGFKPDALDGKVFLSPRFPLHWNSAQVKNLRVGGSGLDLEMKRGINATKYRLTLAGGGELEIVFKPEIPEGMRISSVMVDKDRRTRGGTGSRYGLLNEPVRFKLSRQAEVELAHTGGVGLIPQIPRPEPGDLDTGFRMVGSRLDGDFYIVNLEGRGGGAHSFKVRHFDNEISIADGCELGERQDDISELHVSFERSAGEFTKKSVKIKLG